MGRLRHISIGASTALALGLCGFVAAPAASADPAPALSITVNITSQGQAGDGCQWYVDDDVSIDNETGAPATVQSVDRHNYDNNVLSTGGLEPGVTLQPGVNSFPGQSSGGAYNGCYQTEAQPPLVVTVATDAGTVSWNQAAVSPQVVTGHPIDNRGSVELVGSFNIVGCQSAYFEYGRGSTYGSQVDVTPTPCPPDNTVTTDVSTTLTGLKRGVTDYHYRLVVIDSNGQPLYGEDWQFSGPSYHLWGGQYVDQIGNSATSAHYLLKLGISGGFDLHGKLGWVRGNGLVSWVGKFTGSELDDTFSFSGQAKGDCSFSYVNNHVFEFGKQHSCRAALPMAPVRSGLRFSHIPAQ